MVAIPRSQRLTLPLSTVIATGAGALVALAFIVVPAGLLGRMVVASGIPAVLAAAEPPLGFTARIALAILFGGGSALFAWFAGFLAVGTRTITLGGGAKADGGPVWRTDLDLDTPRAPVLANRDLGTPFLEVRAAPVERPLPADLDQPLAMFDPNALRAEPLEPPAPVAPLPRIEAVAPPLQAAAPAFAAPQSLRSLHPDAVVAPAPEAARRPPRSLRYDPNTIRPYGPTLRADDPSPSRPAPGLHPLPPVGTASLGELLRRLEHSVGGAPTRPQPPRGGGLGATLDDLRRMATQR